MDRSTFKTLAARSKGTIKFIRFRSFYDCGCMADIVYQKKIVSLASEDIPKTARAFLNSGNVEVTTSYDKLWGFEVLYTVKA